MPLGGGFCSSTGRADPAGLLYGLAAARARRALLRALLGLELLGVEHAVAGVPRGLPPAAAGVALRALRAGLAAH